MEHRPRELEEDEIDLRELFSTIWNNKWKIMIFSFLVTSLTLFFMLRTPNSYTSSIVLIPQEQSASIGGIGALAGFAGVDIGGGEISIFSQISTILSDEIFLEKLISENNLLEKIENPQNLVFALGLDFKIENDVSELSQEERIYNAIKSFSGIISVSEDKKSGVITFSGTNRDRFFAKELVDLVLTESTKRLREIDMKDIDSKVQFYEKELQNTDNLELQKSLTKVISSLIEKRVSANANEFYLLKKITDSKIAFIKDKTKPKRGLIIVVAFVVSIILGIFGVFFIQFLKP
ncbi:uncharacterized protein involved in exopolysaccharide biosynthesis [Thiovulum sp. ES]|nr:uncharacterized protein involved in exopolysaccharide biosynthesis [Thiovulum sp. ES]